MKTNSRLQEIADGRWAHASGALWLPEVSTALLADVHLGYGWAQRRRRELGPVTDGGVRTKLECLVDELRPRELVVLGDLVHAPNPAPRERELIESTLAVVADRTRLTVVPGNHDRGLARDFPALPVRLCEEWRGSGLLAVHGHRETASGGAHLVVGHLHPAVEVFDDAGAAHRIPAFLAGTHATVLPAFSPLARGASLYQVLTPALRTTLGRAVRVYAASGRRVVAVGLASALR